MKNVLRAKLVEEQIKEYRDYQKFERVWDKKYGELLQKDPTMSWEKANEILGDKNWPGPINCVNPFRPTGLFETMVSRVCPYTIKGFLYYQASLTTISRTAITPSSHLLSGFGERSGATMSFRS